jgi:L-malate glycosyltransferase
MKILVLSSSYPTGNSTHEGRFVADLLKQLPERGIFPVVLAPHFPGGLFKEFHDGTSIFRFPYFFPLRFERLAYGAGLSLNIRRDFFAFAGIIPFCIAESLWTFAILFRERVSIIHTHWLFPQGFLGALIHRFTGIPHVATVHGSDLAVLRKSTVLTKICSFIIRNSDAVTVNSRYTRQQLISFVPGSDSKIQIIPMGVDSKFFHEHLPITEMKKSRQEHIILSVGRLIELKGIRYLIEAMPVVIRADPDARLVIIGTGPEEERLVKRVRELFLDDHVQFLGNLPHNKLKPYYQDAVVFVLPSITINGTTEGLGVVLLEAMASGCPVIGSNTGGIPDIIDDGENGFLVPEQDPMALAERIVLVLSDAKLKAKFRENGFARIRKSFTWEKISNDFFNVYNQVISQKIKK